MEITQLRQKHPKFTYQSYNLKNDTHSLTIQYVFKIEPDIIFTPEIILPLNPDITVDTNALHNLAFHLGMIESISYWKATCSPEFIVQAGSLTEDQLTWWKNLFIHGLGEFYYKNEINFSQANFLTLSGPKPLTQSHIHESTTAKGELILVGGGKDSGVTIELLKIASQPKDVLILNPIPSAVAIATASGYPQPLIVKRIIDPKLLQLNAEGYLNGHTPFSAYLAFLSTLVALLHDYKYVIVSNERSASEGNIMFHGLEINHQYSKSYEFEKSFRQYSYQYLSKTVEYFSFLRPLYDLQISELFAKQRELHNIFHSCNVNQKLNSWCGKCPKCAFVYMSLFPYLDYKETITIFGSDFFLHPEIQEHVRDLVGLGNHKPFECVGTEDESKLAIALSTRKYRSMHMSIPPFLSALEQELKINERETIKILEDKVNGKWNKDNFLPEIYKNILKKATQ